MVGSHSLLLEREREREREREMGGGDIKREKGIQRGRENEESGEKRDGKERKG